MTAEPAVTGEPAAGGLSHQLRHQLPLLVWLVLVWGALWGDFGPGNLILGCHLPGHYAYGMNADVLVR